MAATLGGLARAGDLDSVERKMRWESVSPNDPAAMLRHTEECRASLEKLLCERGDPRFQASYARMAEQAREKEKGEKREPEPEEEDRQPKRQRKDEDKVPLVMPASSSLDARSANEPNEEPELDKEFKNTGGWLKKKKLDELSG